MYHKYQNLGDQTWNCSMYNRHVKREGHLLQLTNLNFCGDLTTWKKLVLYIWYSDLL